MTPISIYPDLVAALACVKQAAALANQELGLLDDERAGPSSRPATTSARASHDQFVVDVIQGGAGTSTNMNANEVIANRGAGTARPREGDYESSAPARPRQPQPDAPTTSIPPRSTRRWRFAIARLLEAHAAPARRRSGPRPRSSATCSRWGARSCRTRCR